MSFVKNAFLLFFLLLSCNEEKFSIIDNPRACYDLVYSHLSLEFSLSDKKIRGSNKMNFNLICPADTILIDLANNLLIDSILLNGQNIPFKRNNQSVLMFNSSLSNNLTVEVFYYGNPVVALNPPWKGGFVWSEDEIGSDWFGVACQKEGGSIWWPNKHDLSDEPDSMKISISVPFPYIAVSNGKLINIESDIRQSKYTYEWFVSYPINNYNVTANIANYQYFNDTIHGHDGLLNLEYYVLPENFFIAQQHFQQVKPMLHIFENLFGPYPFYKDNYKLVETSYLGMEHQSCISYGNNYMDGYLGAFPADIDFDFIIIHESAHEWWGNSVSMENIEDMWIHESFATYAEALYVEKKYGYNDMLLYLEFQKNNIKNTEPIYVNKHTNSDMYYKGSWMLHTLRTLISEDDLWFALLKQIQIDFKHSIVNTDQILTYITTFLEKDLDSFFHQYLYCSNLPVLEYYFEVNHDVKSLYFRWESEVNDFDMPLLAKINNKEYDWIYPSQGWKSVNFDIDCKDFKIADDLFLIQTKQIK
tara:strand:+ start:8378 stop:9970 length:1593 start_codon:yes stop_codon:yes gene_type:complete